MSVLRSIATGIGIVGITIIILGLCIGLVRFAICEINSLRPNRKDTESLDCIRDDIGRHLLFGLDFLVATDLIMTVIEPTLQELAILGGLVVIRLTVGYFRYREMPR